MNRDEKPNNCIPENDGAPTKKAEATTAPPSVPPRTVFLFRYQKTEFYRGELDETCTIVRPDGSYHWEKGHQGFGGGRRDRIAEGQIDKETIQELKELLSSPDLRTAPSASKETWAADVTGTVLWIGREDKIQHLVFYSAFNTLGNPQEIGGTNNLGYISTSEKILEPLRRWMKQHTDNHAARTEREGVGNDCYSSKSVVDVGPDPTSRNR